jgi:hypothetical protein
LATGVDWIISLLGTTNKEVEGTDIKAPESVEDGAQGEGSGD